MAPAHPILWSFRRCPYAMRARLSLHISETVVEHREILLRDKPQAMLDASAKGTVPVLVLPGGDVLEESLDVMHWALRQNDPQQWLEHAEEAEALIARNDGPFKHHLDRYKYAVRYENADPEEHRAAASDIAADLDARLAHSPQLTGARMGIADAAIFPFLRQFANTDRDWFDSQPWPRLQSWLNEHVSSSLFAAIMEKHPLWQASASPDA